MIPDRITTLLKQISAEIDKTTDSHDLDHLMEALYDLGDKADNKLMDLEGDLTEDDWDDLEDEDDDPSVHKALGGLVDQLDKIPFDDPANVSDQPPEDHEPDPEEELMEP